MKSFFLPAIAFLALAVFASGQGEPQGVLLYQEPATTYTEAFEYRFFRQDNALYSTITTTAGQRKQLRSGGVVAVVPYPPISFDRDFAETAEAAIAKIHSLERSYPAVEAGLKAAAGKWSRALSVFHQTEALSRNRSDQSRGGTLVLHQTRLQHPHISRSTSVVVTIAHSAGLLTVPIAELTSDQILLLNRASDSVQLPLHLENPPAPPRSVNALTLRIESTIGRMIDAVGRTLGLSGAAVHVWTFFVLLPVLTLLLLGALIFATGRRRSPIILRRKL